MHTLKLRTAFVVSLPVVAIIRRLALGDGPVRAGGGGAVRAEAAAPGPAAVAGAKPHQARPKAARVLHHHTAACAFSVRLLSAFVLPGLKNFPDQPYCAFC